MIPQHSNVVLSSFAVFLDTQIQKKGAAFTNTNSFFYPTSNTYQGLFSYSAPYKPFVYDFSVGGATIPTGVWLDSNYLITGQQGFSGVNYNEGIIYFGSGNIAASRISGSYAVKEIDVLITSQPEEEILFETQYKLKNKIGKTISGIAPNNVSYPVVFLKNLAADNKEWAFGGTEKTTHEINAIIISDSQYNLDATLSIFNDSVRKTIPILSGYEMPFNAIGSFRSGVLFNYDNYTSRNGNINSMFISSVECHQFGTRSTVLSEFSKLNPEAYPAVAVFSVETIRNPRS